MPPTDNLICFEVLSRDISLHLVQIEPLNLVSLRSCGAGKSALAGHISFAVASRERTVSCMLSTQLAFSTLT